LERLASAWPDALDEIALFGFSMGGLVARSACHAAEAAGHAWRGKLAKLVCLGTPHHGAPLERAGNWVEPPLGLTSYSAPLARRGRVRSAGITDLRYGNVIDEHWRGLDRFVPGKDRRSAVPLPEGVKCFAVAATTAAASRAKLP